MIIISTINLSVFIVLSNFVQKIKSEQRTLFNFVHFVQQLGNKNKSNYLVIILDFIRKLF